MIQIPSSYDGDHFLLLYLGLKRYLVIHGYRKAITIDLRMTIVVKPVSTISELQCIFYLHHDDNTSSAVAEQIEIDFIA